VAQAQQPEAGKLVKVAMGGKLHKRGGKTHFPCELKINKLAREGRSSGTHPAIRSRKLVKVVVGGKLHRRRGKTHFPFEL
jgi:hypothetical protein